jgi:hypothetical protein
VRWTEQARPIEWEFKVVTPGTFDVEVWTAAARNTVWQGTADVSIVVAEQQRRATLTDKDRRASDRSPHQLYSVTRCGPVRIDQAGTAALRLTGVSSAEEPVPSLRMVRLLPVGEGA